VAGSDSDTEMRKIKRQGGEREREREREKERKKERKRTGRQPKRKNGRHSTKDGGRELVGIYEYR